MGRKKEKHGAKPAEEANKKKTCLIQFDIENPLSFRDKLYVVQADKYNWTAHFYRGRIFEEEYLICDVYCHCNLPSWSCDNRLDIRIFNQPVHTVVCHFQLKRNCMSCPPFLKWSEFVSPKNDYIRNGQVTIQIYVTELPKKMFKNPSSFMIDYPGIKNAEINVGKAKFYVNKELLAFTSRFFLHALNYGHLNSKDPYVIDDVSPIDFKLYLDLTYHPKQYFSAYHAKDILTLARRFDNLEVVQACQNVLVEDLNENKMSPKEKAKLTEAYDLETVKELFNPEAVLRPQLRPRFMPADYNGKAEPGKQVKKLANGVMLSVGCAKDPSKSATQEIPQEDPDPSPASSSSTTSSTSATSSSESLPKLNYEDEVIVIDDSSDSEENPEKEKEEEVEEEEEEDEEFDISVPSTSGCYGY